MSKLDTSPGLLPSGILSTICIFLALANALVVVLNLGIGLSYNPDFALAYTAIGAACVAVLCALIWLSFRRWSTRLKSWPRLLAFVLGVTLAVFGAYALGVDQGDWFLWIWPFLLGVSAILMAV